MDQFVRLRRAVSRWQVIVVVAATAIVWALLGARLGMSVAVGGLLGRVNFTLHANSVAGLAGSTVEGARPAQARAVVSYGLRYILLAGVLALAHFWGGLDLITAALGLMATYATTIAVGIMNSGVRRAKVDDEPGI